MWREGTTLGLQYDWINPSGWTYVIPVPDGGGPGDRMVCPSGMGGATVECYPKAIESFLPPFPLIPADATNSTVSGTVSELADPPQWVGVRVRYYLSAYAAMTSCGFPFGCRGSFTSAELPVSIDGSFVQSSSAEDPGYRENGPGLPGAQLTASLGPPGGSGYTGDPGNVFAEEFLWPYDDLMDEFWTMEIIQNTVGQWWQGSTLVSGGPPRLMLRLYRETAGGAEEPPPPPPTTNVLMSLD